VTSGSNTYNLYYDALGRCVKRVLNSAATYYIYDGEKPILEYRSTDLSHPAKDVYGKGIDEILMRYDPSFSPAVIYYYQQDHEGSVTHLLNASGNVIEKYNYDAFGAPVIYDANGTQLSSSAYSNRFLFTGREYVNLFGFYEYRARAYNPTLGRFMSEDPKLFDAGDYNLFRYCHNDPIDITDPMGTDDQVNARTIERLKAWEHGKELFGGGAIEIGSARYAINQMAHAEGLLKIAQKEFGVTEVPGPRSNPRIVEYLKTTTVDSKMCEDSTRWCSAFVNWVVTQGGLKGTNSAAALSWRRWGQDAHSPALGAIAVIDYGNGTGHVGFVQGITTKGRVVLLGGNQKDAVRYSKFGTAHIVGYRVPNSLTFYRGSPVMRGLLPAPVYNDTGAELGFDGTR
jgi:uncharacterized protein (TIGR02594 family)